MIHLLLVRVPLSLLYFVIFALSTVLLRVGLICDDDGDGVDDGHESITRQIEPR